MPFYQILIIVVAAIAAFFVGIGIVAPALAKKGVPVGVILDSAGNVLDIGDNVVDTLQEFIPDNPALKIIDKIIEWSKKGVESAEQIYKASQMEVDNRKEEAKKFVMNMLELAEIEDKEKYEEIIDKCIEAAVFYLPKTRDEGR